MLLLSLSIVNAQNIDSTNKAEKGFFKGWRVAGVRAGFAGFNSFNTKANINVFSNIASHSAQNKISSDIDRVQSFPYGDIYENINVQLVFPFRVVFKPKTIEPKKLKSYIELSVGIRYSINEFGVFLYGREKSSFNGESFDSEYTFNSKSLSLDGLATIQTPGVFSVFSIYTGIGAYVGGDFDKVVYSLPSMGYDVKPMGLAERDTIYNGTEYGFKKSVINTGIYFPLGIKFNVSKKLNVFIEYVLNSRSILFSNLYHKSFWYLGSGIGFRYKFVKPQKKKRTPLNAPANPPKPFY